MMVGKASAPSNKPAAESPLHLAFHAAPIPRGTPSPGASPAVGPNAPAPSGILVHDGGLHARRSSENASSSHMAGRAALPVSSGAAGIHDASSPSAAESANPHAHEVVITVAESDIPTLPTPSPSSRRELQRALAGDMRNPMAQLVAHDAARKYGQEAASLVDQIAPVLHKVAQLAVAGTSMAFGVGRNSGMAAGDAAGRAAFRLPVHTGVYAGPAPAAHTLSDRNALRMGATGLMQWGMGAATGAAGNMAGQYLVAPVLNKLLSVQFHPIPDEAILPRQVREDMNELAPGSGDELLGKIKAMKAEVSSITSESNVFLGQVAFDVVTAARSAALSTTPLGVAGQVGFGLAVSATAGAIIGGTMGVRLAMAAIEVPNAADLRARVEEFRDGGPQGLNDVRMESVPLFYAKHTNEQPQAAVQPPAGRRHLVRQLSDVTVGAISQNYAASPLRARASPDLLRGIPEEHMPALGGSGAHTALNFASSWFNRAKLMATSTVATSLASTASGMLASTLEGDIAKRAVLALGNAIGIHTAVRPWFNALAGSIVQTDSALGRQSQQRVDVQAFPRLQQQRTANWVQRDASDNHPMERLRSQREHVVDLEAGDRVAS